MPASFVGSTNIGPLAAAWWTFSDGATIGGLSVVKIFAAPGLYSASLTVTTTYGQSFSTSTSVTASAGVIINPAAVGVQPALAYPSPVRQPVFTIGGLIVPTAYPNVVTLVNAPDVVSYPSVFGNNYPYRCLGGFVLFSGVVSCR